MLPLSIALIVYSSLPINVTVRLSTLQEEVEDSFGEALHGSLGKQE